MENKCKLCSCEINISNNSNLYRDKMSVCDSCYADVDLLMSSSNWLKRADFNLKINLRKLRCNLNNIDTNKVDIKDAINDIESQVNEIRRNLNSSEHDSHILFVTLSEYDSLMRIYK